MDRTQKDERVGRGRRRRRTTTAIPSSNPLFPPPQRFFPTDGDPLEWLLLLLLLYLISFLSFLLPFSPPSSYLSPKTHRSISATDTGRDGDEETRKIIVIRGHREREEQLSRDT